MANPETALLQFVALALPAVAILMQAILSFQEQHGNTTGIDSFEFRFIELGFFALAGAGVLFAVEIFSNVNSQILKLGIGTISASFLLLALATAFGLRRPKYQGKEEEEVTLEQAVYTDIKRLSPIIGIIIIGSIIVFVIGTGDISYSRISKALSSIISEPSQSLQAISGIIAIITLTYSLVGLRVYFNFQEEQKEINQWYERVAEFSKSASTLESDFATTVPQSDFRIFSERVSEYQSRAEELIESAPEGIDEDIIELLERIQTKLEITHDIVSELDEVYNNLAARESRIDSLEQELSEKEEEYEDIKEAPESGGEHVGEYLDELTRQMGKLQNEISDNEMKLNELQRRRQDLSEELEDTLDEILDKISLLQDEVEKK